MRHLLTFIEALALVVAFSAARFALLEVTGLWRPARAVIWYFRPEESDCRTATVSGP